MALITLCSDMALTMKWARDYHYDLGYIYGLDSVYDLYFDFYNNLDFDS